jgi:flagellar protein FlaJ
MIQEFLTELEGIYKKSGLTRSFEEYISAGRLILIIGFIVSFLIFTFLHNIFRVDGVRNLLGSLVISVVSTAAIAVLYAWYPVYNRDLAVSDINRNLLNSVTFMLMLSKGGLSIERIIERVAESETNVYISALLNKFLVNIKVYGFNPQESLQDISKRSPSELFTQLLNGIVTTTQTTNDFSALFEYESDVLLQRKQEENETLLNNIGFLSEIYVTLLVIAPLLMIILLTTFSFTSNNSGSGGINALNLVVFTGIPIIAAIIMILVDMQVTID